MIDRQESGENRKDNKEKLLGKVSTKSEISKEIANGIRRTRGKVIRKLIPLAAETSN